jgi:hypothetical protein
VAFPSSVVQGKVSTRIARVPASAYTPRMPERPEFNEEPAYVHTNGSEKDQESGHDLDRLWRRYRLKGEKPRPGSIAEQRLIAACQDYVDIVLNAGKHSTSDERRRQLHNQIAVMVVGEARTSLSPENASAIADFAAELTYGRPLDEISMPQEEGAHAG